MLKVTSSSCFEGELVKVLQSEYPLGPSTQTSKDSVTFNCSPEFPSTYPATVRMVLLILHYRADVADDDVTTKRNYIRWLAYFSVHTYIEYCKMMFISKVIRLKNTF
jgi:hypothetical protein